MQLINIHTPHLAKRKDHKMTRHIPEKLLVATINAINAMGPTPLSEKIFRENIIPGHDKESRRAIAIANYVSLISPARHVCDWYTVALFSTGVSPILMPDAGNDAYTELLLQSCGIPSCYTTAIREANSPLNTGELSLLALAIRFADIHVDEAGGYVKLKDGIRFIKPDDTGGVERELMNLCYELEKRGKYEKWIDALDTLCKGGSHGGQKEQLPRQPEMEKAGATS